MFFSVRLLRPVLFVFAVLLSVMAVAQQNADSANNIHTALNNIFAFALNW